MAIVCMTGIVMMEIVVFSLILVPSSSSSQSSPPVDKKKLKWNVFWDSYNSFLWNACISFFFFFCCPHKNDVTDFVFVFVFRFCCFQWIYTWFFVRWNMFSIFFSFLFFQQHCKDRIFFSVLFFCFKNRKFLCEFFFFE